MTMNVQEVDLLLADLGTQQAARKQTLDVYFRQHPVMQAMLKRLETDLGYIDEHNGMWRECKKFAVYVTYNRHAGEDQAYLVPADFDSYFTINPLSQDANSGKCLLSRFSMANAVVMYDPHKSIAQRLREFNDRHSQSLVTTTGLFLVLIEFRPGVKQIQTLI
jgi:hypothetical protein